MTGRLPLLYQEGKLVTGVLQQPAQQIEIAVEDTLEVQRSHFFDDVLEREEAARLAALLDFVAEPWQDLRLFRAWVHAQRDAVVRGGGITLQALQGFAGSYAEAYQQATGKHIGVGKPEVVENPPVRKLARPPVIADDTVPLTQFEVDMKGLDETFASFLLIGLSGGPESMPLVANTTTGDAVLFRGNVAQGQRLWLRAAGDGSMTAQLEERDVTEKLISIHDLQPGAPWNSAQIQSPATAIRLARGKNQLWFLPVAHFDELGLDRYLLALADLALEQGRWDEAGFDHALFCQDPAVMLKVAWAETEPASVEIRVPGQSVLRQVPAQGTAEEARDELDFAVDTGIKRLKAAGVRSRVRMMEFSEMQASSDFLTGVLPMRLKEAGSSGGDRIPDKGGLFGVTEYGESTFR
jgi:hypothetical protein